MIRSREPTNDPLSFAIAWPLAQSYADLGLDGYNRFALAFQRAQEEGTPLEHNDSVGAIAAATVLSLAAELFLKVLVFQRTGAYPKGHELETLVGKLPLEVQQSLKQRFEGFAERMPNLLQVRFEMRAGQQGHPEEPVPEPSIQAHSFEESVARASPLFVKLRYLYEEVTSGFASEIDFRWLMFLIDSLRQEIDSHENGDARISWTSQTSDLD